jgi:hypothetical protein
VSRANYMTLPNFKWGQSVAWSIFGKNFPPWHWGAFSMCLPILFMTPNSHQSCGQTNDYECQRVRIGGLCEKWRLFCFVTFLRAQITTQSLHFSPTLKHLLKEQKFSYPMHVSGHENGGVRAEICLRKVKWDYLADRG